MIKPDHDDWLVCKVKDATEARRVFQMPPYWPVEEIKGKGIKKDKQGGQLFRVLSLFSIKKMFEA